jgi:[ribosomal protein S5]-alanine N-acetyltransferase
MTADAAHVDHRRLRRVRLDDAEAVHVLVGRPQVYRYLFDGVAPDRDSVVSRIAQAASQPAETGLGMWILQGPAAPCAGCVELRSYPSPRSAEITWLLDPCHWGRGLATRMAWTVIAQAFRRSHVDLVIAGADLPNTPSFAVMRRLGMRFHGTVQYPLGVAAEYALRRGDPPPVPEPVPIALD